VRVVPGHHSDQKDIVMQHQFLIWTLFNLFIVAMLALDLGVFHRKTHTIAIKEALLWTAFWIVLAMVFNVVLFFWQGYDQALRFFTGYLIEKSLSMDNLFVFLMIFSYFSVPGQYQHKVLFWGILGALVMRAVFIFTGVALISKFHWVIYLFGAFLVFTGIRMCKGGEKEVHPEKNPLLGLVRRFMPVTENFVGDRLFVRRDNRLFATPLFIVLVMIESTDVMFAVDSIPAILAVTTDPFIVYSSNVMAILGLRALYFALAGLMRLFRYLHYGLAAILVFVGCKMLISDLVKIPIVIALAVIVVTLLLSVTVSVLKSRAENDQIG
jgi:tellurite resistance protein TerC